MKTRGAVLRRLYALEGIDGAGKSTAIGLLKKRASDEGKRKVAFTAEPTERGRAMLAAMRAGPPLHPDTLAFLFAGDRWEHVFGKGGIREQVKAGRRVFCDRYILSSLAYQGALSPAGAAFALNMEVGRFPLPEIVFYFELDLGEALSRIRARGKPTEAESPENLAAVKEEYERCLGLASRLGSRVVRIDATRPPEEVAAAIWREAMG